MLILDFVWVMNWAIRSHYGQQLVQYRHFWTFCTYMSSNYSDMDGQEIIGRLNEFGDNKARNFSELWQCQILLGYLLFCQHLKAWLQQGRRTEKLFVILSISQKWSILMETRAGLACGNSNETPLFMIKSNLPLLF